MAIETMTGIDEEVESSRNNDTEIKDMKSIMEDLTSRMTQVLNQNQTQTHTTNDDSSAAQIGIKLDGSNYPLWSQIVEMYISGKDKLGYINGDLPQPLLTDPGFRKWRTENAIVKGWLINSMDTSLIGNFIRFPTAKMVWDSIAITYFDGSDTSQVYDLKRQVTKVNQAGGSIEKYYNDLQHLWREIDFRRPNPMVCPVDIQKYNSIIQEDRVYVFLDGLDDRLDKIRSDVLQLQPFPTVEQAYAHVRREDIRQAVMITGAENNSGVVMASKGVNIGKQPLPPLHMSHSLEGRKKIAATKTKAPSEDGGCTHCGKSRHIRENCFKLHGYPEWWNEYKAKKQHEATTSGGSGGRAALMNSEPQLSFISSIESQNTEKIHHEQGYSHQGDHWAWY
ncbi:uncharacterized protein LOC123882926 [Trifolium pratense]|uniref:uncharacterized protein LOC123882926 n=1 Tax=Trifolium pratense TaxID=57577 RepID=UPI001E6909A2|nr:uncharacterized protein LOC123882926 [Trifolium pratense]